jgi:hypothetical protein
MDGAKRRGALSGALKVHLRVVDIAGVTYRVASLRPATRVRFSSNYFHETWHILVGSDGADLLARILWGLAFQRQPGTLFLIDQPHLVATPFEADPADPIAIVPAGMTPVDRDRMGALRRALRRAPVRTIRWHTFGLERALVDERDELGALWYRREHAGLRRRERMSRIAGVVCFTSPPALLRASACGVAWLAQGRRDGYLPLAAHTRDRWCPDGEVQLLPGFAADVAAAAVARREIIGDRAIASDDERDAIYARKDRVAARRRRPRGPIDDRAARSARSR